MPMDPYRRNKFTARRKMSVVLLLSTRHALCPDGAASSKPGALSPSLC